MIATMTVLVSGLTIAAALDDAEAKKAKTGEHKLKCKSIGSWFNPDITVDVISSSQGKCSAGLGKITSAGITAGTFIPATGCVALATLDPVGLPDYAMGKKGFIEFTSTAVQCFNDSAGVPLGTSFDGTYCGPSVGSAYTSDLTGTYTITAGLVKDVTVMGGTGTLESSADHCDPSASNGNSFTTKLEGTIVFP